MMRVLASALAVMVLVLPLWADDGDMDERSPPSEFSLGMVSMTGDEPGPATLDLALDSIWMQDRRQFDASSALDVDSAREYRVALWNSPLARTGYAMASEQAMLGREGLVNGGHMLGLGLSTTVLGDASHGGAINVLTDGRARWGELSAGEKFQVGLEATIAASILYAIFGGLN